MQINRKYFQKSNTVYVFPVGFIQDNDVFDKEFIKEFESWYDRIIRFNVSAPVGIENIGGSKTLYKYYLNYEIPSTAVYITDSSILGGL